MDRTQGSFLLVSRFQDDTTHVMIGRNLTEIVLQNSDRPKVEIKFNLKVF